MAGSSRRRKRARISHRFKLVCLRPASTATATGYPARPTATSRRRRDCGKYSISLTSVVFISVSPVLLHQSLVVRVQQDISSAQPPLTNHLAGRARPVMVAAMSLASAVKATQGEVDRPAWGRSPLPDPIRLRQPGHQAPRLGNPRHQLPERGTAPSRTGSTPSGSEQALARLLAVEVGFGPW